MRANLARKAPGAAKPRYHGGFGRFTPDADATWLLTELDPDEAHAAGGIRG
jgi:hypothetical protein